MKLPKAQKLPSGMYRCQVMVDGERVSVVDADIKVAQAKAVALKTGLSEKKQEKAGNITLENAIEQYILARENVLSPSTINGYKEIKRNRFKSIMKTNIDKIDEMDLQAAVNKEATSVSHKTIKNALGLTVAVISQYKPINIKRIKLPQKIKKEHEYLDADGIMTLFEKIEGSPVEIPILLAVWLGMRRSEIMGLCWDSIDTEKRTIKVQRTYVKDKEKGYVLRNEMKTAASRRTLECPCYIMDKLSAYQPDSSKRTGRIFKMHPNTVYETMKKICEREGIGFVGVHGLRHTNASVMLSLGIVDKVAMARGGWSTDVTMKQVYQHVFESDKQDAGNKLDNFFNELVTKETKTINENSSVPRV